MKPYQLLIFDFDGTLVDTAPDIALHANAVLEEFGLKPQSLEAVKRAVGHGVHELMKDLGISEDETQLELAVTSFKKRYWERPVINTRPYPGVREALSGPLENFQKVIVTNKPHGLTVKILGELSLASYFQRVIGLDMGYPAKPNPASTHFAINQCGAIPDRALFIGDSPVDAETCKNAGIDFAWVDYGYARLDDSYHPVIRFSSAHEWRLLKI